MSRGIHTKPNEGLTVDWQTPPALKNAIGGAEDFALDPCASPNQFYRTAVKMVSLPKSGTSLDWEDGLSIDWNDYESIWLNHPFGASASKIWMSRMAEHGCGVALLAVRTETEWFRDYVWRSASAVLFIHERLHYYKPDGKRAKGNAGHGSVLAAYGKHWSGKLLQSGIDGQFLMLKG